MARDYQKQLEYNRRWRAANPDKVRGNNQRNYEKLKAKGYVQKTKTKPTAEQSAEYNRQWRERNPGAAAEATRKWREENREEALRREREWAKANRHKLNAKMAARRTAAPPWEKAERHAIAALYAAARAAGMCVDHIYPIKGPNFCGLHCLANLQLLTPEANGSKGNRPPVDGPYELWEFQP